MPKRDEQYMRDQRDAIARAALDVLIEKGVYETSLRDICKAAGISIGALYTHFKTKDEAIVAACALDFAANRNEPLTEDWPTYVASMSEGLVAVRRRGSRQSKRFRLTLQFVAELSQMERSPEGLSEIYQSVRDMLLRNLGHLSSVGIVNLPLGLETTADIHFQLIRGAHYQLASDPDLDPEYVASIFKSGLALTAGMPAA